MQDVHRPSHISWDDNGTVVEAGNHLPPGQLPGIHWAEQYQDDVQDLQSSAGCDKAEGGRKVGMGGKRGCHSTVSWLDGKEAWGPWLDSA